MGPKGQNRHILRRCSKKTKTEFEIIKLLANNYLTMSKYQEEAFIDDQEYDDCQNDDFNQPSANQTNNQKRKQLEVQREENDGLNATYSFQDEGHTLGNLLRNQLIKSNKVEFCAYSVPHPSEPYMNVRLQLCNPDPSKSEHEEDQTEKAMRNGLKRISKVCDALSAKFTTALEKFEGDEKMQVC
jgi:DNA-directed RNA polymerase I and III subunit RPAC2